MTTPRRDGRIGSPFSDWVRTNPRLDSKKFGVCNQDIDWIWHQYLVAEDTIGKREVNHIILIEEKASASDLSNQQRDTMFLVHQALAIADGRKLMTARGDKVMVRFWGYYKLRYSGSCLVCSSELWWNKRPITLETLERVLRFELRPDTLAPLSDRRHHIKRLPLFGDENRSDS